MHVSNTMVRFVVPTMSEGGGVGTKNISYTALHRREMSLWTGCS
jgi:hypothetical protein